MECVVENASLDLCLKMEYNGKWFSIRQVQDSIGSLENMDRCAVGDVLVQLNYKDVEEYENIEEFIESSVKMNRQLVFEFVRIWKRKNWKMEYKSSRKAIRANLDEMPKFAPSCENIIQAEYSVPDFGFELLDSNFIMDAVALTVKDVDDSIENILTKNKFQYLYIYAINHFVVAGLPVADVRSRLAESEKIPMELQLLPTNETFVSDKQALTLWITSENPISKYNLVDVEVVASTPRIIPKACMQKNCCKFRHFIPPELYGKFVYQINHVNVIELDFHQIPDVIALKNTNVLFTLIDVAVPFNKESTINKRIIVDMELSKWIKYDTNVNKSQNSDKPTEFINNAKETQNSQVKSTNIHFELGPSPNEKVINQKERAQYSSKRELVRAKRGQVKIIKSNRGEQCSIRTMDCNSFQIRQIRLDAHTAFPGIVLQNTNSIGLTIAQFTRKNTLKHFCENIQVGDVLTSVNGQSTMDIPTDELYQTLRGHAKGSRVLCLTPKNVNLNTKQIRSVRP